MLTTPLQYYGYRVLENDDDGDPLDHGVVAAYTAPEAFSYVRSRLTAIRTPSEAEDGALTVRLYPLTLPTAPGLAEDAGDPIDGGVVVPRCEEA